MKRKKSDLALPTVRINYPAFLARAGVLIRAATRSSNPPSNIEGAFVGIGEAACV
jgi:hypothetical protein